MPSAPREIPSFQPAKAERNRRRLLAKWRAKRTADALGFRALDLAAGLAALGLAAIATPFLLAIPGQRIESEVLVGRYGRRFRRLRFNRGPRFLKALPTGLNLLKGEVAVVGPRPLTVGEARQIEPASFRRMDVRPGLVSLHRLRKQTNIDFENEFATDAEYIEGSALRSDLGLIARYATTAWAGDSGAVEFEPKVEMLGVPIDNVTMPEAIDWIVRTAEGEDAKQLCFVNADCLNLTFKHQTYSRQLLGADLILADGIGVKLAGKLTKKPIVQNVNGTDLFPRLCERLAETGQSLYLLGGREGVAEDVAAWIEKNHPGCRVAGYHHGFFTPEQTEEVKDQIRDSGADILLVAFGAPKQDTWISENLQGLGPRVAMGVGGLFDFYSDRIPRAPQWLRELGLEWSYRLIQEPRRMWRRYLVGNVVFLARVFRYRNTARRIR